MRDIGIGVVVIVERGRILTFGGAACCQIPAGGEHGIIDVVDIADAIIITIDGVVIEGGGHKLHRTGGAGIGSAGSGAGLAGFDPVNGG